MKDCIHVLPVLLLRHILDYENCYILFANIVVNDNDVLFHHSLIIHLCAFEFSKACSDYSRAKE